jgi:exoribonuclease-2
MPSLDRIAREVLVENGFQPDAGEAVEREIAGLRNAPVTGDGVKDLRALRWSSIDNTSSRDLDQIEVAEEKDGGIVLRIGIADVDSLVPKGSAIDAHAEANATSVYTGVTVYPMLPEQLSTGLTSLNENAERLVLVIEVELASDGAVRRHDVYRALATNHAKLAYESVGPWLEGHGPEPEKLVPDDALEAQLWLQDRAASLLKRVREEAVAL